MNDCRILLRNDFQTSRTLGNGWKDFYLFLIFYLKLLFITKVAKKSFSRKNNFFLNFCDFSDSVGRAFAKLPLTQ